MTGLLQKLVWVFSLVYQLYTGIGLVQTGNMKQTPNPSVQKDYPIALMHF